VFHYELSRVGQNRQLAAIMFTDIVGYTALMGSDEQRAISLLHDNREIHETCIKRHDGLFLKEMGDGVLAQFHSALDAVQCAIEIQRLASERVEGKLRIGIHLGDVIIEHNDVFGDGVNIASRLQAIADPGGIYVSESVQNAIRNRSDVQMQYLAEVQLKNVDYPIKTFSLQGSGLPITPLSKINELSSIDSLSKRAISSPYTYTSLLVFVILVITIWWWIPSSKRTDLRLAVLPTIDMSGEQDGEFIAAGLHAPIIDEIIKVTALQVISRTSSARFGSADKTVPEIASALKVDMVVESELTHMGDSVRLQFRLIQAFPEEIQLWSKAYNRVTADILSIYGDVAMEISRATNIELTSEEISLLTNNKKVNPEAYKAYLTGRAHLFKLTSQGIDMALQYFNSSIEKDSTFAPAYMGIAFVWGARRQQGLISLGEAMGNIERATQKAIKFDSRSTEQETDSEIHFLLALTKCWINWQWEESEEEFKIAIKLDPNHAEARAYYSLFLNTMHRSEEAKQQIERAMELEPYSSIIRSLYGMYLRNTHQPDEAVKLLNKTLAEDPEYGTALGVLWTIYNNKEMFHEAVEVAKRVYTARREERMVEILTEEYIEGDYKSVMEKLAEAYIVKKDTAYVTPWQIATLYTRASNEEKALEWLEKAYEEHDDNMYSISADPIFDEIREHPRYQKLLNKMGLPQ
jgi:adenylate cyclase